MSSIQNLIISPRVPKRFWGRKSVFLGSWCFDCSLEYVYPAKKVVPYHWDDRQKLYDDYIYLKRVNSNLIDVLTPVLNKYHNVHEPRAYWELLIGYWINICTAVLFDRWSMLKSAEKLRLFDTVVLCPTKINDLVTNSVEEFVDQAVDDNWNFKLYSSLFADFSFLNKNYSTEVATEKPSFDLKRPLLDRVFDLVKRCLNSASSLLGKNDEIFCINTYLPRKQNLKLALLLFNSPRFWWSPLVDSGYTSQIRSTDLLAFSLDTSDEFSIVLEKYIPYLIPKVFIEDYPRLRYRSENLGWPDNPKVIFTSASLFFNSIFNHWAAKKCQQGALFITGEHGGFGPGKFNASVDYQLSCSDVFLSAGWHARGVNTVPMFNFRTSGRRSTIKSKGGLLLVQVAMPRYAFDLRSMPISGQMLDYFEDQFEFVEALSKKIQARLQVRLYQTDYGWKQKERWLKRFPEIKFDKLERSFFSAIKQHRLVVVTYCATTWLDLLNLDVPVVVFWNKEHWEVDSSAIPLLEELASVGIFHFTPVSAARHLELVWEDVMGWWRSAALQVVRMKFCCKFSQTSGNDMKALAAVLEKKQRLN